MSTSSDRVMLAPLSRVMIATRLEHDSFTLACDLPQGRATVRFGAEWPGDALALFPLVLPTLAAGTEVEGTFVLVDRSHRVVGQVGTMGPVTGGSIEIGYGINRSEWGRGLATEGVAALLTCLGRLPDLTRVTARTAVGNLASQRVLIKSGFRRTGLSRSDEGDLIDWVYLIDRSN